MPPPPPRTAPRAGCHIPGRAASNVFISKTTAAHVHESFDLHQLNRFALGKFHGLPGESAGRNEKPFANPLILEHAVELLKSWARHGPIGQTLALNDSSTAVLLEEGVDALIVRGGRQPHYVAQGSKEV